MEQLKQPLTLEKAAELYANMLFPSESGTNWEAAKQDFKAGAQWQKEQDKSLVDAAKKIMNYYHPNTYDDGHKAYQALKNAIEKYNNQS